MDGAFILDSRLGKDSIFIAEGPLSQLRLMDDSRFTWLLLVPRKADAVEWTDLDGSDQRLLLAEINQTSALLQSLAAHDKINIAALGNIVRQFHVHVVARHAGDAAWPGPVWGSGPAQAYAPGERDVLVAALKAALAA